MAPGDILESLSVGQLVAIVAGIGVLVVPIVKLVGWLIAMSKELDSKITKTECENCRKQWETFKTDHSIKLETKAAKVEVENLMYRLGEQANSLTEIRAKFEAELKNISEKLDSLTRSIERLIDSRMNQ